MIKAHAICDEDKGLDEFQFGVELERAALTTAGKKESSQEVPVASPPGLDRIGGEQETSVPKPPLFGFLTSQEYPVNPLATRTEICEPPTTKEFLILRI